VATEEGVVIRRMHPARGQDAAQRCVRQLFFQSRCHYDGRGKEMEVAAVNTIGRAVGDRVVIKMDTAPLLKGTFRVYLSPFCCWSVGAAAGEWISRSSEIDSPWPSAHARLRFAGGRPTLHEIMRRRLAKKDASARGSQGDRSAERAIRTPLNAEPKRSSTMDDLR